METTARSEHLIPFKTFELDLLTRELHRNGQRIKLRGHPIDVLAILLERPGELVTREELQEEALAGRHLRRFRTDSAQQRRQTARCAG